MRSRCSKAILAVLLLAALAAPAAAQLGKKGTQQHRHSSTNSGGNRLDPVTLNVSGTATFTGPLVADSSATLGISAQTSTITLTSAYVNGWTIAVSTRFYGLTGTLFITGLSTGMACDVKLVYSAETDAMYWRLRFNNDAGSNYAAGLFTIASDGSSAGSARGGTEVTMQRANTAVNESGHMRFSISYEPNSSHKVRGAVTHEFSTASLAYFDRGGYRYSGSSGVSNFSLTAVDAGVGGKATGRMDVLCLSRRVP